MSFSSRAVDKKILSREQGEGAGARVRRSIGRPELRSFDPFLMLDEFRVPKGAGFPDHPHRGFETVTYMLKGRFEHEDFCGHRGKIGPGDLQWMTAGRGIVHSEMPDPTSEENAHGLQLWVNLKSTDKMCEPKYQELLSKDIPLVSKDGVSCHVIAGQALGTKSPVYTATPVYYLHFKMAPNSTLEQEIPPSFNTFAYILDGEAFFGDKEDKVEPHYTITLTKAEAQSGLRVTTKDKAVDFVLIGGEPIGEPVVQHGPFVMNSEDQIRMTMFDFSMGKNGFEGGPGWRSEIGKPLTGGGM